MSNPSENAESSAALPGGSVEAKPEIPSAAAFFPSIGGFDEEVKMVLVVRTDLGMGKGKIAAQCCHAAIALYEETAARFPHLLVAWYDQAVAKIVLKVDSEKELDDLYSIASGLGLVAHVVHDAGRTQIAAGSKTVVGIGPDRKVLIDQVTGHLKLLN